MHPKYKHFHRFRTKDAPKFVVCGLLFVVLDSPRAVNGVCITRNLLKKRHFSGKIVTFATRKTGVCFATPIAHKAPKVRRLSEAASRVSSKKVLQCQRLRQIQVPRRGLK